MLDMDVYCKRDYMQATGRLGTISHYFVLSFFYVSVIVTYTHLYVFILVLRKEAQEMFY